MNAAKQFVSLLFLSILFSIGGCKSTPMEILSFNLDTVTEETELKLSEVVDNIQIIPLETNDSLHLRPNYTDTYRIAVTDEFIFFLGDDGVILFDAKNGKYLRRLTSRGNGPKEHGSIYSSALDSKNNLLYIAHMNAGSKLVVNFKTGKLSPAVPDTSRYQVRDLLFVLPDGTLCGDYLTSMFCRLDPAQEGLFPLIDPQKQAALQTEQQKKERRNGVSARLYKDRIYLFKQAYSDTLYQYLSSTELTPILVLLTNDTHHPDKSSRISIPYLDAENTLCIKIESQIFKQMSNGVISSFTQRNTPTHLYRFGNKERTMKRISKLTFDPLFILEKTGAEVATFFSYDTFSGPYHYAKILDAYVVKTAIQATLKDNSLPKNKREKLLKLDARLGENDNPVVIIGTKK